MTDREKRRYFRIDDMVGLHYAIKSEVSNLPPTSLLELETQHRLEQIDDQFNTLINALWQELPIAAEAIGLINKKVAVLQQAINKVQEEEVDLEDTAVNISACGIAFRAKNPLQTMSELTITLGLKPSNILLKLEGLVRACDRSDINGKTSYLLRVEFINLKPITEEQLIQHIVQRQSGQLAQLHEHEDD